MAADYEASLCVLSPWGTLTDLSLTHTQQHVIPIGQKRQLKLWEVVTH